MSKADLRKQVRLGRRALTDEQRLVAGQGLLQQLQSISALDEVEHIAMYLANDGEIDPQQVVEWCWQQTKKAYVPMVMPGNDRTLLFAEITADTQFVENKFGIREPNSDPAQWIAASQLDLVLMPLVAFDESGNRIGMGGGFYDTTFAFLKDSSVEKPRLIGIAHELQKISGIPAEPWDIPLLTVVTDKRIYQFG